RSTGSTPTSRPCCGASPPRPSSPTNPDNIARPIRCSISGMRSAVFALAGFALAAGAVTPLAWAQQKVLRYNFDVAETSADPHRVSDIYSNTVISAIFDSPLDYDYLAR